MRRLGLFAIGLVAFITLLWVLRRASPVDEVHAPTAETWLKTVTIEPAATRMMSTHIKVEAHLGALADRQTQVLMPVAARVLEVKVQAGDVVKKNQVLAVMDSPDYAQTLNDVHSTTALAHQARAALIRKQALHDSGGASNADLDQAKTDAASAEAALSAARQRAQAMGLTASEIDALGETLPEHPHWVLRAPLDGVVLDRALSPGQFLAAQAPALTVADVQKLWVIGEVPESQAGLVHVGQSVEIKLEAHSERPTAVLEYVGGALDPVTHRLTVKATIANPGLQLKPAMLAEMKVALGPAQLQLAVPESAVVYEDAVAHVWVVTDAKQLQYRRIETGAREDGVVVVTKGLHEHERIVTRGGLFIDRSVDPSVSTP